MNEIHSIASNPTMMSPADTGVLVIDIQEKLISAVLAGKTIAWNARRLIDGAAVFNMPVAATEQYPKGLGPTVPELAERFSAIPSKLRFSCCACSEIFYDFQKRGVKKILLSGIETHVCVQQTALDLLADGWNVFIAVDAVGSRFDIDHQAALKRLDSCGATLTTTEAAIFEWCREAGTPEFKKISALAKEIMK
jgi:nicotinamidase-related amidase